MLYELVVLRSLIEQLDVQAFFKASSEQISCNKKLQGCLYFYKCIQMSNSTLLMISNSAATFNRNTA